MPPSPAPAPLSRRALGADFTIVTRSAFLFKLAELMERDAESLAVLESLDVGKPITNALKGDIPGSINTLRYYAEALDKIYGEVGPGTPDRFSFAVHEPLGVVGAIVPWNFPLLMAMWKIAPALAMGNSVILKPAEQSPLTALKIGELALEAGLPPAFSTSYRASARKRVRRSPFTTTST